MDTLTCIKKTYSCKSYLDKKVTQKDVAKLLEAARHAPSAGNMQNRRFIVIRSPDIKEKLARYCLDQLWMQEAPVIIAIISEHANIKTHFPKNWKKFCKENCAAAAQNIILEATNLKLSSCWVRSFNESGVDRTLKIPDNAATETLVTIGHSKDKSKERKQNLEELTFFEVYGQRERDNSLFPLEKHLKKLKRK